MLETNVQDLTVTANQTIAFSTNTIQTGTTVTHVAGSTAINLNRPGIYEINFNAYGVTTGAGAFGAQLNVNGTTDTSAKASTTTTEGATAQVAFTKLIRVVPSCTCINNSKVLTIVYTGSVGTLNNANLVVTKLK